MKDAINPLLHSAYLKMFVIHLLKRINKAMTDTNTHRVLIVGGVASNGIIRNGLTKKLDGNVYFAKAEYSTDKAVGTAYLAHLAHKEA